MEGASTNKKRRNQGEEGLNLKHNTAFQGSMLKVQCYANNDGLLAIFFPTATLIEIDSGH